jgi:hypothetical protein
MEQPVFARLAVGRLGDTKRPVVLLGIETEVRPWQTVLTERGWSVTSESWQWGGAVDSSTHPDDSLFLVCSVPVSAEQWLSVQRLRHELGTRFLHVYELTLPLTIIAEAHKLLPYHKDRSLESKAEFYLGDRYLGPLAELNTRFPMAGKRVIEFGPFDGHQTAGLHHLGAASVLTVEARADNALKVLAMNQGMGWNNVSLVMDDFHNVNAAKYGRFDLAFAHGVYYHSAAPFILLENLVTLSDNVFLGGFCATDDLPDRPWTQLVYAGKPYRVKDYSESNDITAPRPLLSQTGLDGILYGARLWG